MPPISRRTFLRALARATAAGAAAAASGAGYSLYAEPGWLSVERVTVRVEGLPPALAGLRVAQLSDIHASPVVAGWMIEQAAAAAMRERPDVIALTGDYVTDGLGHLPDLAPLGSLRAPLGVFAVLGNHDHWTGDPGAVASRLRGLGARVLVNEGLPVAGELWLAGVDDVWERRANLAAALRGAPAGAPALLLAHEPDFADTAALAGVGLQLSGHSHGGQVRIPGLGAPLLPWLGERYPIGLQRVPGSRTQVYTNRGVGMVGPAVRLNCRPELTVIELAAG